MNTPIANLQIVDQPAALVPYQATVLPIFSGQALPLIAPNRLVSDFDPFPVSPQNDALGLLNSQLNTGFFVGEIQTVTLGAKFRSRCNF